MKVAIGQDSHRFDIENKEKKLILGGVVFENELPMKANSDGDLEIEDLDNYIKERMKNGELFEEIVNDLESNPYLFNEI